MFHDRPLSKEYMLAWVLACATNTAQQGRYPVYDAAAVATYRHRIRFGKMLRHSQNRKYITYRKDDNGGSSQGHNNIIIIFWPQYSIPREWKKYTMQYKKVYTNPKLLLLLLLF